MSRPVFLAALGLATLLAAAPAAAQKRADEAIADPALEARLMKLSAELRCLVCQNQSLSDSNADLAVDLRNQVRAQMRAGRSDREIADWLVARYGDFVLYRPPVKGTTVLLWAGPFVLLVAGLAALVVTLRRRRRAGAASAADAAPDAEEQARAAALLERRDGDGPA